MARTIGSALAVAAMIGAVIAGMVAPAHITAAQAEGPYGTTPFMMSPKPVEWQ